MQKRKSSAPVEQLDFFIAEKQPSATEQVPSQIDLMIARLEKNPFKTKEEYQRWIKHLINRSIKSIE
jgi:hypothetical protein